MFHSMYNAVNVYCRELAPGTVSLTGDRAQGDDNKHWAYSSDCIHHIYVKNLSNLGKQKVISRVHQFTYPNFNVQNVSMFWSAPLLCPTYSCKSLMRIRACECMQSRLSIDIHSSDTSKHRMGLFLFCL